MFALLSIKNLSHGYLLNGPEVADAKLSDRRWKYKSKRSNHVSQIWRYRA